MAKVTDIGGFFFSIQKPKGRFARVYEPQEIPIAIWQPKHSKIDLLLF